MLFGFCLLQALFSVSMTDAGAVSPTMRPFVQWKYGWRDGMRANTLGSVKNANPVPMGQPELSGGYSPAQISQAYGFDKITNGDGTGVKIAIIDAYGNPTMTNDLVQFSKQYGITNAINLQVIYPDGAVSKKLFINPNSNASGWRVETCMDVEWAHAMAPGATICLIVCSSDDSTKLFNAISYAQTNLHANLISMSWGSQVSSTDPGDYDAQLEAVQQQGIGMVASTGDTAGEVDYPACSPFVTAAGGTSLYYNNGAYSEVAWSSGGGGLAAFEPVPFYQENLPGAYTNRAVPDVSCVADPYTGMNVLVAGQWQVDGGTSLSAPIWAALLARRASQGNTNGAGGINALLYAKQVYASNNVGWPMSDVVDGSNVVSASVGYDLATGLGSLLGLADQVAGLTSNSTPSVQAAPTASPFAALSGFNGSFDGIAPEAGLVCSGGVLYGTTSAGGTNGNGTLFAMNTDGTGFRSVYQFTVTNGSAGTNGDGANPGGRLILSGNTLYGTTTSGGSAGNGTIFAVNTDGTGFTTLHQFSIDRGRAGTNADGASPMVALTLSTDGILYGAAAYGGVKGNGTLFAVSTNGTGFTTLHQFSVTMGKARSNPDGANPESILTLSTNGVLYGTTCNGGGAGNGTIFAVNTNGTGFVTLHGFSATRGRAKTNLDGANPVAGLTLSTNGVLYGTASNGGIYGNGTLFAVNTNGTGFVRLYGFSALNGYGCNPDGAGPQGALTISSSGTLYGTTSAGGNYGNGTLFSFSPSTNGTGFTDFYDFTGNADGYQPVSELILIGSSLFGTCYSGGDSGNGTVFGFSPAP
jgi:uncharacterized repeat protein (TIGR03803 family)